MSGIHNRICLIFLVVLGAGISMVGCSEGPKTPAEVLDQSFKVGDWNTTITICDQLLEQRPDDTDLLTKRAQAFLATENFAGAVADYSRLIELLPEEADPYYGREAAYLKLGNPELALADGHAARKRDPLYEAAYAYHPSNFIEPLNIETDPVPSSDEGDNAADSANNATSVPDPLIAENATNRTSYDDTVFSDEAGFEPDPTSRVLATEKESTDEAPQDAADIGIPKTPKIVTENHIPALQLENQAVVSADPAAPEPNADGALADFKEIRFPAVPTEEEPEKLQNPDQILQPNPGLSTSLPTDELGQIFFPNTIPNTLSTGLQNEASTDLADIGLGTPAEGRLSTGLNAPAGVADFNFVNPITPAPPNPGFNLPNLINGPPPVQIGLSGLPLPNGSTGLPTGTPAGVSNGPARKGDSQFRGNPVYGPNSSTISTSLPGYGRPNSVPPNAAGPVGNGVISTSLSDSILQDRLRPAQPTQSQKFRSIQP